MFSVPLYLSGLGSECIVLSLHLHFGVVQHRQLTGERLHSMCVCVYTCVCMYECLCVNICVPMRMQWTTKQGRCGAVTGGGGLQCMSWYWKHKQTLEKLRHFLSDRSLRCWFCPASRSHVTDIATSNWFYSETRMHYSIA